MIHANCTDHAACISIYMPHVYFVLHAHVVCPCPCCTSMLMLHVHVHAALPCSSPSVHVHVHVHAVCPCPCCMTMSMLLFHVYGSYRCPWYMPMVRGTVGPFDEKTQRLFNTIGLSWLINLYFF
jgi:hypothetical protein